MTDLICCYLCPVVVFVQAEEMKWEMAFLLLSLTLERITWIKLLQSNKKQKGNFLYESIY